MTSSEDFEARFERRLRGFAVLAGTRPDPEVVSRALAARSGSAVSRPGRVDRLGTGPASVRARTLLLVAVLALGAIGTALVAGSFAGAPLVAPAPSPSPASSPSPTATATASQSVAWPVQFGEDRCPGGTLLADIRDTSPPGASGPRWVAEPRPATDPQGPSAGKIAVTTDTPGGPGRVYLVDPLTGTACLLAELPLGMQVGDVKWAPAGDALAVSGLAGDVFVWSRAGASVAFTSGGYGSIAWSPDGAWIAVGWWSQQDGDALMALPVEGPPVQFSCELKPGQSPRPTIVGVGSALTCPAFPHIVWSPDSTKIAIGGGDRVGLFGVASLADPTFRRLALGRAIEEADTIPLGWLDAQTLLAADQDGTLLEIPVRDPAGYRIRTEPPGLSVLSPTLDRGASISKDGLTLTVRNLASGQNTEVFSTSTAGAAAKIDNVAFAPDGKSILFTVPDLTGRPTLQVVNTDGTGLRQLLVGRFDVAIGAAFADSPWQPTWP